MKMTALSILFLLMGSGSFAQTNLKLNFIHQNPSNQKIKTWKYYVSEISLRSKEEAVKAAGIFLIDKEGNTTIPLSVKKGNYDSIFFRIGVDSLTNSKGLQEGDLDPMKGMYWTWQSGYINWKFEMENTSGDPIQKITHHIGGFTAPFNPETFVSLPLKKSLVDGKTYEINILVSPEKYLEKTKQYLHIMQPGKEAVEVAKQIPLAFSITEVK